MIDPKRDDTKNWWESKTLWASIITAILPLIPPVGVFAAANPELYSAALGAVFAGLRIKTNTAVKVTRK